MHHFAGQYHEAIEIARETLAEASDNLRARVTLGLSLQQAGRIQDAARELEEAYRLSPGVPLICGALGNAYAADGRSQDAGLILRHLQSLPHQQTDFGSQALIHAGLGNKECSLALLEKACDEREFHMVLLKLDRRLDCLRDQPRFHSMLERVGLGQ